MPAMTDVKVEQCDREAALAIKTAIEGLRSGGEQALYRSGAYDHTNEVQAFARHRQAAEKAQQERDAGICDTMKVEFADADNAGNHETEEAWHGGMAHAASRIATAIRSQGHE